MTKLVLRPLIKYATFSGCSNRLEYWSFMLLIALPLLIVGRLIEPRVYGLLIYFFFLPINALCTRRFHDIGLSGYAYLSLTALPIAIIIVCDFYDMYFGITRVFGYRISWLSAWLFACSVFMVLLLCCLKGKNSK